MQIGRGALGITNKKISRKLLSFYRRINKGKGKEDGGGAVVAPFEYFMKSSSPFTVLNGEMLKEKVNTWLAIKPGDRIEAMLEIGVFIYVHATSFEQDAVVAAEGEEKGVKNRHLTHSFGSLKSAIVSLSSSTIAGATQLLSPSSSSSLFHTTSTNNLTAAAVNVQRSTDRVDRLDQNKGVKDYLLFEDDDDNNKKNHHLPQPPSPLQQPLSFRTEFSDESEELHSGYSNSSDEYHAQDGGDGVRMQRRRRKVNVFEVLRHLGNSLGIIAASLSDDNGEGGMDAKYDSAAAGVRGRGGVKPQQQRTKRKRTHRRADSTDMNSSSNSSNSDMENSTARSQKKNSTTKPSKPKVSSSTAITHRKVTPYSVYSREHRARFKQENPKLSPSSLTALMRRTFERLDDVEKNVK